MTSGPDKIWNELLNCVIEHTGYPTQDAGTRHRWQREARDPVSRVGGVLKCRIFSIPFPHYERIRQVYTPTRFQESRPERLEEVVDRYPFGSLITVEGGKPCISHVPFLRRGAGLLCHLATANPHSGHFTEPRAVTCVFHGPDAYVSPSNYSRPGVPTWNYVVVHLEGMATAIADRRDLAGLVDAMAEYFERTRPSPWQPEYSEAQLERIIGLDIRVDCWRGKFKLSQNRLPEDRSRVISDLSSSESENARALAHYMQRYER